MASDAEIKNALKRLKHAPHQSFVRGLLFKRQESFGGLLGLSLPSQILYEKLLTPTCPDDGACVQDHLAMINTKVERLRSIEKKILSKASRRFMLGRLISVATACAFLLTVVLL